MDFSALIESLQSDLGAHLPNILGALGILIIGWLLGFFVYSAGGLIHALLVLAIIAILINIIRGRAA